MCEVLIRTPSTSTRDTTCTLKHQMAVLETKQSLRHTGILCQALTAG